MARRGPIPQTQLPYNFQFRAYQSPLFRYIASGGKRAFFGIHRRAGKDLTCWNILIYMSQMRVGNYLYLLPTQMQAMKIIWQGKDGKGRPFLDYIPQDLLTASNKTELVIELKNGSLIQLDGTDETDRLIGQGPVGVVFSEFQSQKPDGWEYVSPMLVENGGWAIFNGTARPPGEAPHFYDMHLMASENPDWFHCCKGIDETKAIGEGVLDEERAAGRPESFIRQEYYMDFHASSENILIDRDLLSESLDRVVGYASSPAVAGIDVGHSLGGDPSAIVIRRGGKILCLDEIRSTSMEEIGSWARRRMYDHGCRTAIIDGIGWGAGLGAVITGRDPSLQCMEINVAERPSDRRMFPRTRDELWWRARKFFESRKVCIPSKLNMAQKFVNELTGVEYRFAPMSNKIKVQGKEEMKKAGMKSPNLADAFCLSLYLDGDEWSDEVRFDYSAAYAQPTGGMRWSAFA